MAISDISIFSNEIARSVASGGDTKIGSKKISKERYDAKQSEILTRTNTAFSSADTGSFMTDAGNKLAGLGKGVSPQLGRTSAMSLSGPAPYEVGKNEIQAGGQYVTSVEELEYDMGSATRDISEIIVHWSETFTNANLSGSQVKSLIGGSYHYIIKRDGSIERDVSIKSAAGHAPGHDTYSIGVLLIGGVAAATEDQGLSERKSASNITRSQYNSLYGIMRVFYTQYPGGQALGHSEIDPSHDDPGFEVRDYAYNLFNKISLFTSEGEMGSQKSPKEINAAEDGGGTDIVDKNNEIADQKF